MYSVKKDSFESNAIQLDTFDIEITSNSTEVSNSGNESEFKSLDLLGLSSDNIVTPVVVPIDLEKVLQPIDENAQDETSITIEKTTKPTLENWKNLALLAITMICIMSLWFSASVSIPQYKLMFSLSDIEGSIIVAVVNVGFIFGGVFGAATLLFDRFSPRILMGVGGLVGAAINLILLSIPKAGFPTILVVRFLTGVCLAFVYGPGMKAASMWFVTHRGLVLGVMVGALTLGSALPNLINGLATLDSKYIVIAASVLSGVGSAVALLLASDGPYTTPLKEVNIRCVPKIFSSLSLTMAVFAYACHAYELYAMWSWVSFFYFEIFKKDTRQLASLFAFMVIGLGAFGCVAGGWVADRIGRTALCLCATILSVLMSLIIGPVAYYTKSEIAVWFIGAIWGFVIVGDSAQYSSMISELCPQDLVGTALTLQLCVGYSFTVVAMFLTPVFAATEVQWTWTYAISAAISCITIVLLVLLRSRPDSIKIGGGKK